MIRKIIRNLTVLIIGLMLLCCQNTKQKLQEYVANYNKTTHTFEDKNIKLSTARGYLNDNKIELRFETNLTQNTINKSEAEKSFPFLLIKLIKTDQVLKELLQEGVQFDTYFLANDNTVLDKEILNKEKLEELLK